MEHKVSVKFQECFHISVNEKLLLNLQVVGPHLGKVIKGPWKIEGARATHEGEGYKVSLQFSYDEELTCKASIVSDSDSLVGLLIPVEKGSLKVQARPLLYTKEGKSHWPEKFSGNSKGVYQISEHDEFEGAFYPFPNPLEGELTHKNMKLRLFCQSEESCFYYDMNYLGVVSAYDPWHPNLTASTIQLQFN